MYRIVMVPTDGSDVSRHAIPLALAIARPSNATLHLVAVMESSLSAPIYGIPAAAGGWTSGALVDPVLMAEVHESERETQKRALDVFAERLAADARVRVVATLAEGDVAGALARHTREKAVDLVAMATHGRGGVGRAVLGSVTDALIRNVSCPVLVARPHGDLGHEHEPAEIKHVLVALDGSAESDLIATHAAEVAHVTGARCTLLHVNHPEIMSGVSAPDALLDPASTERTQDVEKAHLDRFADLFRLRAIDVSATVIRSNNPKATIIEYAGTHAVDLIAMTTHARHGLARLMLGSTASAILHETRLPMLVLHSGEATLSPERPT